MRKQRSISSFWKCACSPIKGYKDQLALGFKGLMNQINCAVWLNVINAISAPHPFRWMRFISSSLNTLPVFYLIKIAEARSKLGAWLWFTTQNIEGVANSESGSPWYVRRNWSTKARGFRPWFSNKPLVVGFLQGTRYIPKAFFLWARHRRCIRNMLLPLALTWQGITEKHEKRQWVKIVRKMKSSGLDAVFDSRKVLIWD